MDALSFPSFNYTGLSSANACACCQTQAAGRLTDLQSNSMVQMNLLAEQMLMLETLLLGLMMGGQFGPAAPATNPSSQAASAALPAPSAGQSGSSPAPAGSTPPPKGANLPAPHGPSAAARGTGYFPENSAMEGGFNDMKGHKLYTLQDYLAGRAPYVSVAMDNHAGIKYGTKLRIAELEKKYGRPIEFRVVDTGGAFKGKGTSRIDICTANRQASLDPTINGNLTLHFE